MRLTEKKGRRGCVGDQKVRGIRGVTGGNNAWCVGVKRLLGLSGGCLNRLAAGLVS